MIVLAMLLLMTFFLRQASAFIVTYPVNNAVDKKGNDSEKAVAWEKAFIQMTKVSVWLESSY